MRMALVSLGLTLVACAASRAGDASAVSPGRPFTLAAGERASISTTGVTIGFAGVVADSRCPIGVTCVWAGNAEARLTIESPGSETIRASLNTHTDPDNLRAFGLQVRLMEVAPHPRADVKIEPSDYAATLQVDLPDPAASLVAAERAFARASEERGMKAAFLEFLAPESILFRPRPVAGRAWMEERPPPAGVLLWAPRYAEVSDNEDLGFTTGPWQYTVEGPEGVASAHGHFVSIWRKQPVGGWRVLLDIGISHEKQEEVAADVPVEQRRVAAGAGGRLGGSAGLGRLLDSDRNLAVLAAPHGLATACEHACSEDIRLYLDGAPPRLGRPAAIEALRAIRGSVKWSPIGGGLSDNGELGYTYGLMLIRAQETPDETRSYARVWRRDGDGRFRVALEVLIPVPEPSSND